MNLRRLRRRQAWIQFERSRVFRCTKWRHVEKKMKVVTSGTLTEHDRNELVKFAQFLRIKAQGADPQEAYKRVYE